MLKGYFNQVRKASKLNLNLTKSPETVASYCEKNNYCEAVSQKNKDEKLYIYEKLQYNTFIEDKNFSIVLPLQISSFTNSKRGKLITWQDQFYSQGVPEKLKKIFRFLFIFQSFSITRN